MVGDKTGMYWLGTGNYGVDPWTPNPEDKPASDCAGFAISWCWKLRRHRPGFNKGGWATVEDDLNVNSIMEDAVHRTELAVPLAVYELPKPGDLLCYPSFIVRGVGQKIGHVAIIEHVPDTYVHENWRQLHIIHCHGPARHTPAVERASGYLFEQHDNTWPTEARRTKVIRMKERA